MKSQMKRIESDKIIFHWDHNAPSSSDLRRNAHSDPDRPRSLDEYFDLLDEIRPHIHELRHTKMYDKPFTL